MLYEPTRDCYCSAGGVIEVMEEEEDGEEEEKEEGPGTFSIIITCYDGSR